MSAQRICFLVLAGGFLGACSGATPILLRGDANSAQVGFSGSVDAATRVAKQHCAQYERVPRFLEAEEDIAYFDCVRP